MIKPGWYKEYKNSLKSIEIEEVFDLIFYRPLAFILVKLIYRTNITPNQLTAAAMTIGLVGDIFFAVNLPFSLLIASLFLIIYDVFDCADGQLARLKKNGTPAGRILDGLADYVVTISAYLAIGIGFSLHSENPGYLWILVIAAGLSNAFHAISLDYYRNRFMDFTQDRPTVLTDGLEEFRNEYKRLKEVSGKHFDKTIIRLYLRYSSIQGGVASAKTSHVSLSKEKQQQYYKTNKTIIHLWTYLGPTSQLTFLIICALFARLDIYLWGLIIVGNCYALILYFFQKRIDKKLNLQGV
jgi:hypothetical protein